MNNEVSIDDIEIIMNDDIELYIDKEIEKYDLPECIICRLTILETYKDLLENNYCNCKFYYHESCYQDWIYTKGENKCLICSKDISSNYDIPSFDISSNNTIRALNRQERYLRRVNFLTNHRSVGCCDKFVNFLWCEVELNMRNSCVTFCYIREDAITGYCCGCFVLLVIVSLIVILIILFTNPVLFVNMI